MYDTAGLLQTIKHHPKLPLLINENCAIPLPQEVLNKLFSPHKLSFYYLMFVYRGRASFVADLQKISLTDGQLVFGLPNQVFANKRFNADDLHYSLSFDEEALSLLPNTYAFMLNPKGGQSVTFDLNAQERVKHLFSTLFRLVHAGTEPQQPEVILAYLNTLLIEINSAYLAQHEINATQHDSRLKKYTAFKLAVETQLTKQPEVNNIAAQLSLNTHTLYGIVKEFAGVSPKEWMTNRLILEARRRLQYATPSVKELAYQLGFNDPAYFSRLFKKNTGKSVTHYQADLQDLYRN
ncbi:helix-turn-helix domain-containing protein [Mucilaginibacter sp. CSA2-8R]|uniref:helix-turn-helix domain-containing protein n=1 Tax=Mucilaginibacter sp. CSA2-8R TaxID=3141542 RepID=UPI00315D0F2A